MRVARLRALTPFFFERMLTFFLVEMRVARLRALTQAVHHLKLH